MFIILIYFCAVFLSVYCQTVDLQDIQHIIRLEEYLFNRTRYHKNIIPRLDQTEPVEINVNLALMSIDGLDEAAEIFKATGYLNIEWKDDLLTWNATDFGDFEYYFFPLADVWKPDMALMNSYTIDKDDRKLADDSTTVRVDNDGVVSWYPYQIFHTTCSVDIHYFPFDIQRCELQFGAWPYDINEVTMNISSDGIDLGRFEGNPEWDIQPFGYDIIDFDRTSVARFSLKLTRKPLYVLITVFLPMILLSILNIFVFILPCESGERSGYAMTVFLAFAVFLTIVSTTLPPSSDTVAISSVFLIILIVQSTIIMIIALLLSRCYSFEDEAPVPKILQWFLQIITCTVCPIKNKSEVKLVQVKSFVVSDGVVETTEGQSNEQTDDSIKDKEKQTAGVNLTWKDAVRKLDIICLIFFSLTLLVSLVACTCVAVLQPF